MSRLTEREIDLIQSARAARRREPAGADHYVRKARALQSETAAEMLHKLATWSGLAEIGAWIYGTLVCPVQNAVRRRRTVQQLRRLDDHLLHDIGLERGLVETFGEELTAKTVAPSRSVDGPLTRCRNWLLRRRAIADLRALSDRQLEDIGVVRADIPQVVDQSMRPAGARRPSRRQRVSAQNVQGLAYQALKVTPPLQTKAVAPGTPANQIRITPMWLGPWLPASDRNVA